MVSKNQIKLITSLVQKKYRKQHQLFLAEGVKVIEELLRSNFELENLYVTKPMFPEVLESKKTIISDSDLKKITALTTANDCLAIFKIPQENEIENEGLIVALDDIRDPGNLGTIIRLCDWFGISQIICSEQTVDVYNPKVVQATMGSVARVNISYVDLKLYLAKSKSQIFGTFMGGENIYKKQLPTSGIIVLGNEANGISKIIEEQITQKITIPRFGNLQLTESLNVASATAIVLSEFRRTC
ncbi:TrmH family RNA methyltransferase [Flavobacterium sp.]|uniref:TrmH family RNA methyltransferase n=1 Tax=Flavobacterium sp. TaxID=239 RepID=UPI0038FCFB0B